MDRAVVTAERHGEIEVLTIDQSSRHMPCRNPYGRRCSRRWLPPNGTLMSEPS